MQTPPRMPLADQPADAGWWLAVDGRWYPPESAPATPAPAPAVAAARAVATGPSLGSPGAQVRQRSAAPPLPVPTFERRMPSPQPSPSMGDAGEAGAIVSLVLGIVTLVFSWWILVSLGFKLGIVVDLVASTSALLLGISARHKGAGGLAIAGITVSAVSLAMTLLLVLNVMMTLSRFGRFGGF